MTSGMIAVTVAFSGGLELLFQSRRTILLSLANGSTIDTLIKALRQECDTKRESLFVQDDTVRPGILVLINDADWELEGEGAYVLQDRDEVLFVSTLHGG